jgi:nickel-dependent lactate racemase
MVSLDDTVAIVFSDITRPMPNRRVLPYLLEELSHIPKDQIVFINALGTHRPNTNDELENLLGPEIAEHYKVVQHNCYDANDLTYLGMSSKGNEIWVNRTYIESTIRVLTGFIEPHLFAGFSGGPKAVLPGIAGIKTITSNHAPHMIADPGSGFAITEGNPIWQEMLEVAKLTEPTFLLNVTLTSDRRINGVFAGDLQKAHKAGVDFLKRTAMVPVDTTFDIAISTAGGYPMDINMYQSVKGIAVAANIVRDGGSIILVSECQEGLPDYGEYGSIMRLSSTPDHLLQMIWRPDFSMQDQWDAQLQAEICKSRNLHIYSDGLTDQEIQDVLGQPCRNVESTVSELLKRYGPKSRVVVLPAGPLTVPYIENTRNHG